MKIRKPIQAKEQGDGQTNGGSSGKGAIQLPSLFTPDESDSDPTDSDLGSDNDPDSPSDIFNRYHKLDSKGNKKEKSALQKAIEEGEGSNKEDNKGEIDDKEEEDRQEPDEKEAEPKQLTDEELLKAKALRPDGREITLQPAVLIKNLKSRVQSQAAEIENLKKTVVPTEEIETLKSQLTEKDSKIQELQERIDEEFFENSEGFKQTFSEPLNKAISSVKKFFNHLSDDKAATSDVQSLFNEASEKAAAGDKEAYDVIVDKIAEEYIAGGTVLKNSFARNAERYFELYNQYAEAINTKGAARKKLVESRVSDNRSKDIASVENDIERAVKKHSIESKLFIDALPPDLKKSYQADINSMREAAKQGIAQFAITGKLPEILNTLISRGVTSNAIEKQREMGWNAFRDSVNQNKLLEQEIESLKKKLGKFTAEPKSSSSRYSNSYDSKSKETGKSRIVNNLQEMGANLE